MLKEVPHHSVSLPSVEPALPMDDFTQFFHHQPLLLALLSLMRNRYSSSSVSYAHKSTASKRHRARVLYSYTPVNDDELQLEVNDIIEVLDEVEEGWWKGILKGSVGVFPSNFVVEEDGNSDVLELSGTDEKILTKSDDPATASGNSIPNSPSHQEVKPKPIQGIGYGNIFKDGLVNLKPTDSAKKSPYQKTPKSSTEPDAPKLPPKPVKEMVRVLFSYEAQNEDELTMKENDIITIVTKELVDKGWWKGELNGKIGVFPDNFVEVIKADETHSKKPDRPEKPSAPRLDTPPCVVDDYLTSEKVTKKGTPGSKVSPPAIPKKEEKPAPPLPGKKPAILTMKKPQRSSTPSTKPLSLSTQPTSSTVMMASSTSSVPGTSQLTSPFSPPLSDSLPNGSPTAEEHLTDDMKVKCQQEKKEGVDKSAFDSVEISPDKLTHLTASRARAPNRRPFSQFIRRNVGRENGDISSEQPSWIGELIKTQSKHASQCYTDTKDSKETSLDKEAKTRLSSSKVPSSKSALVSPKEEDNKPKTKPVPSPTPSSSGNSSPSTHCISSFGHDVMALQQEVDNLKKELKMFKDTSVNKDNYNELQKQGRILESLVWSFLSYQLPVIRDSSVF
ncbi:SH3 domain-containing kinase-binding protein 1-like isoform X2 [Limulus polyphemus]|uniref:SH3 domain-containing kinase-binding protein 1-like isoform X2 n=1 Tax=Limulus polyphemus TaxID=6850 RepID=A0ABM1SVR6_LIMPO|nr:SH3 domain-containing kinase-binding protein 1-like isoform X2 [Limulus polyphemus]